MSLKILILMAYTVAWRTIHEFWIIISWMRGFRLLLLSSWIQDFGRRSTLSSSKLFKLSPLNRRYKSFLLSFCRIVCCISFICHHGFLCLFKLDFKCFYSHFKYFLFTWLLDFLSFNSMYRSCFFILNFSHS